MGTRASERFEVTFSRPAWGENGAVWLHPGEPVFDSLRQLLDQRAQSDASRGAVFVDPHARSSYLLHLARATIIRRADPTLAAFAKDEVLENALVAIRQTEDGSFELRPVEKFLILEPRQGGLPPDAQRLAVSAAGRTEEAKAYLIGSIARDLTHKHRRRLNVDLAQRIEFVRQGFFYEQKQLVEARAIWSRKRREGHAFADREIQRIREQQRAWEARARTAEEVILREPALIGVGAAEFLAHALVRPAAADEPSLRVDAEVERIAMDLVMAHEQAAGAAVHDVHSPELALKAGLNVAWPGFDVLSLRPEEPRRCIEVKGCTKRSNVRISVNEWAVAANRRDEFWLYVVFDCASPTPRRADLAARRIGSRPRRRAPRGIRVRARGHRSRTGCGFCRAARGPVR